MPPTTRRPAATKAPQGADPELADTAPPEQSTRQERLASSATPVPAHTELATVLLRLPFLTVSMSRPPSHAAGSAGGADPTADTARPSAVGSFGLQRLMFYGGVAALGLVGAVDWPVAAAIAAGTYIAARTRSTGQPPGA